MFKNLNKVVAISLIVIFSKQALACDVEGKSGILPKNNLALASVLNPNKISKSDYLEIVKMFHEVYDLKLKEKNAKLDIPDLWDDTEVNAYAHRKKGDNIFTIEIMGGLIRHPLVTKDALTLMMCHEIGHHLGGAPKKAPIVEEESNSSNNRDRLIDVAQANFSFKKKPKTAKANWSSAEGQADYYAAQKCMRKIYEYQAKLNPLIETEAPQSVTETCEKQFSNSLEIIVCKKTIMAGMQTAQFFKSLKTGDVKLSFTEVSTNTVKQTDEGYPTVQCRFDTFVQGSICNKDADAEVSNTDANMGYCSIKESGKVGARPLCWYHPEN